MIWLKAVAFKILISCCLLTTFSAQAQLTSTDSLLLKALATDELLPLLIDSAIKYSPELRRIGSSEDFAKANLQINKKAIFSSVSVLSSYIYGTNFTALNNPSATTGGSNFTTAQTGFYNLGVGIQLPITYVINRKHIIKAGQSQVNMVQAEKDNGALLIKQEVIRLYQEFKLGQRLMSVSNKNKQAAQINNSMAEKNFLNGQIGVDEVSRVLDLYNKSLIEFETYLNKFQTSYMQLEAFTGASLSTLISRVQ